MHQRNHIKDQSAAEQSTCRSERNPCTDIDPAGNETDPATMLGPGDDGGPMILATGSWICGQEFAEGRRKTEVAHTSDEEAPYSGARTAGGEGEVERGGQRGGTVENSKGETKHRNHGEVSVELLLHAETGKMISRIALAGSTSLLRGASARFRHFARSCSRLDFLGDKLLLNSFSLCYFRVG